MMTNPPPDHGPSTADMHWGIAYLREDIQDLRGALASLEDKMDARFQSMMMWTIAGHGVVAGSIIAAIKL